MSGAVDVNLLIYGEDRASPFHPQAVAFLSGLLESSRPVYLTWDIVHSFLRIITNKDVFANPLSPAEAVMDIRRFLDHPSVTVLGPSQESWSILAGLLEDLHCRGNMIPDAVTAAILQANGIKTIYTHDRDFWKFPFLKPQDPFRPSK